MKQYKVGDLAREMGVTPDLLKLYEEYGLLVPQRDPESQYRYYDIYHGGQLVSCLTLRNMGFSVRQTAQVLGAMDGPALSDALSQRRAALEEERARLDRLIPAMEEYAALLEEFRQGAPPVGCTRPGYYFLAQSASEEFSQTEEQKRVVRALLNELPWSERLLVIDGASFLPDRPFRFQWGLALREDRADGWPVEVMRRLPARRCVRLLEDHDAEIRVSREAFRSVADWAAGQGLPLLGEIVCQVPITTVENGVRVAHRAVYLPVEGD